MKNYIIIFLLSVFCKVLIGSPIFTNNTSSSIELLMEYPGTKSIWQGFDRYDFEFQGRNAHIIVPSSERADKAWVWRARFPEWHTEMDSILLHRGFYRLYINTDNLYGSPKAMEIWDSFYEYVLNTFHLNDKVVLEGVSRGGLFVYNWAKRHPEKVTFIYAEAPVCDFTSWPGGLGAGKGSIKDWAQLKEAYDFDSDAQAKEYLHQPMDDLEGLAAASVPILHMIGLDDKVVPVEENSFPLIEKYLRLGGPATIIPCTEGKSSLEGHHFEIQSPALAADMITLHADKNQETRLSSGPYHNTRRGLKNSFIKFEREKVGRVAFVGGSITQGTGWRDSVIQMLESRFPDTEFEFISAGISSMGSTPGAFRLERDVLSKGKIDLLFEEAAVNDDTNGRTDEEQMRAMEGIIRHVQSNNPSADIVLMHFVDPGKMDDYRAGKVPTVIQNHEKVAAHYQVSSINLAKEVTDRIDAGEFTWEDDFKNLHPSPFGHNIYARSFEHFFNTVWSGFVADDDKIISHEMPLAMDKYNYQNGRLIDVDKAKWGKGWQKVPHWTPSDGKGVRKNYTEVPMLVGEYPSGVLKFKFQGPAIGIAVAAGSDAGIIEYSIDGGPWLTQDLYTKWSGSLHLPWYYTLAADLDSGSHKIRIKMSSDRNEASTGNVCRIRYLYVNHP